MKRSAIHCANSSSARFDRGSGNGKRPAYCRATPLSPTALIVPGYRRATRHWHISSTKASVFSMVRIRCVPAVAHRVGGMAPGECRRTQASNSCVQQGGELGSARIRAMSAELFMQRSEVVPSTRGRCAASARRRAARRSGRSARPGSRSGSAYSGGTRQRHAGR